MAPQPFLIITGPTASGKTDIALSLGSRMPVEIINADVGQFYTPLSIGTAKPYISASPIPHHLFNILDEPEDFTVTEYRKRCVQLISEIQSRGNLPIIVGGSHFYLYSLFFPPQELPELSDTVATQEGSWQELAEIDPDRARTIHPHDIYRIQRALALWQATGKKPSTFNPQFADIGPCIMLTVERERVQLYERINQRVIHMLNQGWLEEVASLLGTSWRTFFESKKLIGYREISEYLEHDEMQFQDLVAKIATKTRNYAKRQTTFLRMLQNKLLSQNATSQSTRGISPIQLESINLTFSDLDLYLERLSKQLAVLYTR